MREVTFLVRGKPVPKGSKTLGRTKNGDVFMRESALGLTEWMRAVREEATQNRVGWAKQTPVSIVLLFMFYGPKRQPTGWKATAPDIDKLTRAVFDALQQSKLLVDDAQVVHISASKMFGSEQGCRITVRDMPS